MFYTFVKYRQDGVSVSHRGGESVVCSTHSLNTGRTQAGRGECLTQGRGVCGLFYTFVKYRQDGVSVSHRGGESGLFNTFVKYRQDGVSVSHRGGESVV